MKPALHFVTGSLPKFNEAKAILPLIERIDLDLPEIQELDQKKIIEAKLAAARQQGLNNIIVEDTGLYLEALNWKLPGPFIKWFLKSLSMQELSELAAKSPAAYAQTDIGYWSSDLESPVFFEGQIKGSIVAQRGQGFGWDVIFQPEGKNKTFAEISLEEKNLISHRSQAFKKLAQFIAGRS